MGKSPDDMSVAMAALRATLVAAFVAFASGSCWNPPVELFVGVGCDPSGFYVEALGLRRGAPRRGRVRADTPCSSRCEPDMRASLTSAESAMSRDAGAFQDGRATPPAVEVRWHNGETAACPWTPAAVRAAERAGTVAILRSMAEKTKLSKVLLECCALVHETWVPTEWHRSLYRRAGCENARTLPGDGGCERHIPSSRVPRGRRRGRNERMPTSPSTTVFLSVFQWQARKAPDALLEAYWAAFGPEDNVVLRVLQRAEVGERNPSRTPARVSRTTPRSSGACRLVRSREWRRWRIARRHARGDGEDVSPQILQCAAFFSGRGEGWCLPCAEKRCQATCCSSRAISAA